MNWRQADLLMQKRIAQHRARLATKNLVAVQDKFGLTQNVSALKVIEEYEEKAREATLEELKAVRKEQRHKRFWRAVRLIATWIYRAIILGFVLGHRKHRIRF